MWLSSSPWIIVPSRIFMELAASMTQVEGHFFILKCPFFNGHWFNKIASEKCFFVRVFSVFHQNFWPWQPPAAHALDRWWHQVSSSGAQDKVHWMMGPTFYCHIHMVIEIASDFPAPSFLLISIVPTTVAKDHVMFIIITNWVIALFLFFLLISTISLSWAPAVSDGSCFGRLDH